MYNITELLKKRLDESGMSKRELSLKSGLNESTVKKIFHGKSNNTKIHTIEKLSEGLGCKPIKLLPSEWIDYQLLGDVITPILKTYNNVHGTDIEISIEEFCNLIKLFHSKAIETNKLPKESDILRILKKETKK